MKMPKKFPSIPRIITERAYFYLSFFLSFVVIIALVILISAVIFDFARNFVSFQKIYVQRQDLLGKINFWNSIAEKYSGYPDAYFNIALLYYKLEDFGNARKFLQQTLILNPDYNNASKLDGFLKEKGY